MVGSATFTTVTSRTIMSWPRQSTTSAAHRLRLAADVPGAWPFGDPYRDWSMRELSRVSTGGNAPGRRCIPLEWIAMSTSPDLSWQPSLLATEDTVAIDGAFSRLERIRLDEEAWVDHAPEWVSGSDGLFEEVLASRSWGQRTRQMY